MNLKTRNRIYIALGIIFFLTVTLHFFLVSTAWSTLDLTYDAIEAITLFVWMIIALVYRATKKNNQNQTN
jgi:hypothetical protein